MKAILFKATVVVLLALGASSYFVYLKTGQSPLLDLTTQAKGNWLSDLWERLSFERMADGAKRGVQSIGHGVGVADEDPAQIKFHKWTDEHGQVHFGDRPPVGVNSTELRVSVSDNVDPPTKQTSTEVDTSIDGPGSPLEKARAAVEAMKAKAQQEKDQIN